MAREGLERYARCPLVQHGCHWEEEGEVSQPIGFHHHQSLNCWNEGPGIRSMVKGLRMPSDNETKAECPVMHLTGGLCMKSLSSSAAVEM